MQQDSLKKKKITFWTRICFVWHCEIEVIWCLLHIRVSLYHTHSSSSLSSAPPCQIHHTEIPFALCFTFLFPERLSSLFWNSLRCKVFIETGKRCFSLSKKQALRKEDIAKYERFRCLEVKKHEVVVADSTLHFPNYENKTLFLFMILAWRNNLL